MADLAVRRTPAIAESHDDRGPQRPARSIRLLLAVAIRF
jgi:hypothetical protein